MHIEHVAIYAEDIEKIKAFYEKYFNVTSSDLYHNQKTSFKSYFLTFDSGSRMEVTTKKFLSNRIAESLGYAHIAIAVGDKQAVDEYAERFVKDGYHYSTALVLRGMAIMKQLFKILKGI